jgi:hypothetical protein
MCKTMFVRLFFAVAFVTSVALADDSGEEKGDGRED